MKGSTAKIDGAIDIGQICKELNIKYLKAEQINRSLHKNFRVKAQFKVKINQLRNQGTKLEVLEMTENWINDNIDRLFARFDREPAVNTKAFRKFNSISIQQTQA